MENISEGMKTGDEVRYSSHFLRRISAHDAREKRGVVVMVPQRKMMPIIVRWSDNTESRCYVDNLEKIPQVRENSGDTPMNTYETRAAILRESDGKFEPMDEASRRCMIACGLSESIEGASLAEANVAAGSFGCVLLAEAPKAQAFAEAWDLAHELIVALDEQVDLYDRTQWLSAHGPDHDAAMRVVGRPSAKFVETFSRGLSKVGMVLKEDPSGLAVDFAGGQQPSDFVGRTLRVRRLVSGHVAESVLGSVGADLLGCRVEDTTTGPAFVAENVVGQRFVVPISEGEACLLVLASQEPLVESALLSILVEDGLPSLIGESRHDEPDMKTLCYNSPKTLKGEKKGFATGILYLAPADASGKNVCPFASGFIARQYATRLDQGASVSDLVKAAEKDLRTASHTKKRQEVEDILRGLRKVEERGLSTDAAKAFLRTIGCAGSCLGIRSGKGPLPRTQQARIEKTKNLVDDSKRGETIASIVDDIGKLKKFAARKGWKPTVRLNGTSDIEWFDPKFHAVGDDGKKKSIAEMFPDVEFYDYTKDAKRMQNYVGPDSRFPKNYHLTFSFSGYNWDECEKFLRQGANVAMAFRITKNEPKPTSVNGYRVIDGDESDLRGLDDKGVIVGLSAKGQTGRYVTSFIVSPTATKFKIEWPKDSKYHAMGDEEKGAAEDKAFDRYVGGVSKLDARQRLREEIIAKVVASKEYWKKHVEPAAKRLRKDLADGTYQRIKDYYEDFYPVARDAFGEFTKDADEATRKLLDGHNVERGDQQVFAGRIVGIIKKQYDKSAVVEHTSRAGLANFDESRVISEDSDDPIFGIAAEHKPDKEPRSAWWRIGSDELGHGDDVYRHVECLEDFAGNSRQPGFWADLWRTDGGVEVVTMGGSWADYIHDDEEAKKKLDDYLVNHGPFGGDDVPKLKKLFAKNAHDEVMSFIFKKATGKDLGEAREAHEAAKRAKFDAETKDYYIIEITDGPEAGKFAAYYPDSKKYYTGRINGVRPIGDTKFRMVKKTFGVGRPSEDNANKISVEATFDTYKQAIADMRRRNVDAGIKKQFDPKRYSIVGMIDNEGKPNKMVAKGKTNESSGDSADFYHLDSLNEAEAKQGEVETKTGTTREMFGSLGIPSDKHHELAKSKLQQMTDLRGNPTGWFKHLDSDNNAAYLVHPGEDKVVKFWLPKSRKWSDWLEVIGTAQGYAIDHRVAAKASEPGEMVVKPIYKTDEADSSKTEAAGGEATARSRDELFKVLGREFGVYKLKVLPGGVEFHSSESDPDFNRFERFVRDIHGANIEKVGKDAYEAGKKKADGNSVLYAQEVNPDIEEKHDFVELFVPNALLEKFSDTLHIVGRISEVSANTDEAVVVEALDGNEDVFNALPPLEQIAVQIARFAQHMSLNPLGQKIDDINFSFMFGLSGVKGEAAKAIVMKALAEADPPAKLLKVDDVYEAVLKVLLGKDDPPKDEPKKKDEEKDKSKKDDPKQVAEAATGPASSLRSAIERLLDHAGVKYGPGTDVQFYDAEAWGRRGEKYGHKAVLTMVFEGRLYRMINDPGGKDDVALYRGIQEAADKVNCYPELGHAWSMHFYEKARSNTRRSSDVNDSVSESADSKVTEPWTLTKDEFDKLMLRDPIVRRAGELAVNYMHFILGRLFGAASPSNPVEFKVPDGDVYVATDYGPEDTLLVKVTSIRRGDKTFSGSDINQSKADEKIMRALDVRFPSSASNAHKNAVRYAVVKGYDVPKEVLSDFAEELKAIPKK